MVKRLIATVVTVAAGVGACNMDVWAAVGRTPGQFSVAPMGNAQYSIPLRTPPGPRGIQPQLSLTYDSRSGVGPLGVGWTINGLGAITRCNKTYAQDTTPASVALAVNDGYCLNGNRLRLTGRSYGTAGSTYQTEIADFSQVAANGAAGNGPAYFTVQGRDGLTYQYGYTDGNGNGVNSQVLASGTTTADFWLLSKVSDRTGNNYVVNYKLLTGTAVPDTIERTPTGAGANSYANSIKFNYGNNAVQSSLFAFIGNTPVINTELLNSITVSSSETVVRNYVLAYESSPTTVRERLKTVTECADSAQSNCLSPTTISYQNGIAGVSATSTPAISSETMNPIPHRDLNGDGYPDLVYSNGSTLYVAFGSASGAYSAGVNTGIPAAIHPPMGDLLGTGKDGILANNGGTWWYYTYNGSGFSGTSTGVAYSALTYLIDTNGDGLPDIVAVTGTASSVHITIQLNQSTSGVLSFNPTVYDAYDLSCSTCSIGTFAPDDTYGAGPARAWDFNGDGRQDLIMVRLNGLSQPPYQNYIFYELLSNGTTFHAALIGNTSADAGGLSPIVVDWNNDSCSDAIWNSTIWVSGCNGSSPASYLIQLGQPLTALDWDGDGRTDLIYPNGSTLGVVLSTGNGLSTLQSTSVPYSASCAYFTADVNADGLDDLGCWVANTTTGPYPVSFYMHNGTGQPPDLATSFVDGYGNSVSPSYVPISKPGVAYNAWNDQVYPYQNWIGPLYVAYAATFSDPSSASGSTYHLQYWYAGAATNLQGRGFTGFGAQQQYDSRSGIWETRNYTRAFPYTGMLNSDYVGQDNVYSLPISMSTLALTAATLDNTADNERYFPYASATTNKTYEVGGAKNAQLITTTATN